MSNNKKQQSNPTPAATATPAPETIAEGSAPPTVAETTAETALEAVPENAIVTQAPPAPPAQLATVSEGNDDPDIADIMNPDKLLAIHKPSIFEKLAVLFPKDEQYLKQIRPVSDSELNGMLPSLPEEKAKAFKQALARMNPMKIGSHSSHRDGLKIFDVKVNHGTGNDETRPKGTPEGGLYSTDSRLLATSDRELAELHKSSETFNAYIIADRKGHTLWPPKGDKKDAGKADDGETRANAPLCRSVDQEMGDTNGACAACPLKPFGRGPKPEDDECRTEVVIYVVPVDFSGIYRFQFSGTNTKSGKAICKKFGAWTSPWDHPFSFKTKKETSPTDKDVRWFLVEAEPQRSVQPSPAEREFLLSLALKIDTEVYWPERRLIHLKARQAKTPEAPRRANLQGLLASAQGAAAPAPSLEAPKPLTDHSRGNNL